MDYEKKIFGVYPGVFEISNFLSLFKNEKGKVLDIGCGKGVLSKKLKSKRPDLDVYACDFSKKAIKIAAREPEGVNYSIADCTKSLPFKDGFFDIVYMRHVIEHIEDADKCLKEVRRVLKNSGKLFLIVPLEANRATLVYWTGKIMNIKEVRDSYTGHVRAFSYESLENLLQKNDFKVNKSFYTDFLLYQIIMSAYHPILRILNKDFTFSFRQEYIVGRKGKVVKCIAGFTKTLLDIFFEIENYIGRKLRIPGFLIYLEAKKK